MADLFDTYEEDFVELKTTVENRITSIPSLDGSKRESEIQQAESDIQELEQLVRSMNLSARNVGGNNGLLSKIREYESESSKLKTSLRKATMQMKADSERNNLFGGGVRGDHVLAGSMDQRERLLSATEKLERSNADLQQSIATAEDTMNVGIEVMGNLDVQKNSMYGIKEKLGHVNENLTKAKKIMITIGRRAITNKLIMAIIILVLILAVCLIIYIKFFSGSSSSQPTDTTAPPSPTN